MPSINAIVPFKRSKIISRQLLLRENYRFKLPTNSDSLIFTIMSMF